MCTVSFIARQRGYLLGMNRDESLTRARGLPPRVHSRAGRKVIAPSEPGGGTWISLNDGGVTFALINWYSITARIRANAVSRGNVVNAVSTEISRDAAAKTLDGLPLARTNPFRLIGIFPATQQVVEWRWNLKKLVRKNHPWQSQQWISSGFDEPLAQRIRSETFRIALTQSSAGTPDWLRRLHRSHAPACSPFSTCMHRFDAATVSYTGVTVSRSKARMDYVDGPPCRSRLDKAVEETFQPTDTHS